MIIKRPYWQGLIEEAWKQKNIVWLMGVRRVGKTSLCKSLPDIEYFDCELPRVRQLLADPEEFLTAYNGKRVVLDEIHRLDNPSEILKIAADHYPAIKIIATGSSTLGASAKFRDTLTGRKKEIWLTPLLLEELALFGNENIRHRFLFGGFPSFFVQSILPEDEYREWIDAYWAKDIQEMFKVGKRYSFQKFAELLLAQSGGLFEASKFTIPCEVSRPTIINYLDILEETFVVHTIRPYSSNKQTEIVLAPKVYGFDTGFICFAKGWREIRKEDTGLLWEQCVLNELQAHMQKRPIYYWRSKHGHEIDFVIPNKNNNSLTAVECKFAVGALENPGEIQALGKNIERFRSVYSQGLNFIVAHDISVPFERRMGDIILKFVHPKHLIERLKHTF